MVDSINKYLPLMAPVSHLQWSHGPTQTAISRHYLYLADEIETEQGERQKEFRKDWTFKQSETVITDH